MKLICIIYIFVKNIYKEDYFVNRIYTSWQKVNYLMLIYRFRIF